MEVLCATEIFFFFLVNRLFVPKFLHFFWFVQEVVVHLSFDFGMLLLLSR